MTLRVMLTFIQNKWYCTNVKELCWPYYYLISNNISILSDCLSVCLWVCCSRQHAHISACIDHKFYINLIPTPRRFLYVFWPRHSFLISAIRLRLINLMLLLFNLPSSVCLYCLCFNGATVCCHSSVVSALGSEFIMLQVEGLNLAYPGL